MKVFKLPVQSKYPKKIYFDNEVYRIVFKKGLKFYGETDWEKKTIVIKDGLSPRALFTTLIHELLHVVEFERPSIKLPHKQVYLLETAICELLLDNFL